MLLGPLARVLEGVHDLGLGRSLLHLVVVLPARGLGERHEDALDAPTRFEAEDGAAVVDQVELDVPAAAHLLPLPLRRREVIVLVLGHGGQVGGDHVVEALLGESEDLIGRAVVEVIEKDAAQPARLATVRDLDVVRVRVGARARDRDRVRDSLVVGTP